MEDGGGVRERNDAVMRHFAISFFFFIYGIGKAYNEEEGGRRYFEPESGDCRSNSDYRGEAERQRYVLCVRVNWTLKL